MTNPTEPTPEELLDLARACMPDREIIVSGLAFIVDEADFDELSAMRWRVLSAKSGVYAATQIKRKTIPMHRLVCGAEKGQCVDHVNGNRQDNRRENLRISTYGQNNFNSSNRHNKHGFRGVQQNSENSFSAFIQINGKKKYLGAFNTPEEAHNAYKLAAEKLYGDFAKRGVVFTSAALAVLRRVGEKGE